MTQKLQWHQRVTIQAALIGGVFLIIATIIGSIMNKANWFNPDKKNSLDIQPFDKNVHGILILAFDPLEDCTLKKADQGKAVYKSLSRAIMSDSLINFEVKFVSYPDCPASHVDARKIGKLYNAELVVWGDKFDKCNSDSSITCVNYTITDPENFYLKQHSTGSQNVTIQQLYEGKLNAEVNYVTLFLIGHYYVESNNFKRAEQYFKKAISEIKDTSSSTILDALYYLGICSYEEGKFSEAISYEKHALSIDSTFLRPIFYLGASYMMFREDSLARIGFQRVLRNMVSPSYYYDYVIRGAAFANLGTLNNDTALFDSAIHDFNIALDQNSKCLNAFVGRGTCYFKKGDFEKALTDYDLALQLNPNYSYPHFLKEQIYGLQGNHKAVINEATHIIATTPDDIWAYSMRGSAYNNLGEYKKALADCNIALQNHPDFKYPLVIRSIALLGLDSIQAAIKDATQVNTIYPEQGYTNYCLASCYGRLNQKDSAIKYLKLAIKDGLLGYYTTEEIRGNKDFTKMKTDKIFMQLVK